MTDERKPGRTSHPGFRTEVYCENPADHVFVDVDAERQSDLLANPLAAPGAITPFHLNDRVDQFFDGPFGPGRWTRLGENSSRYFCLISIL